MTTPDFAHREWVFLDSFDLRDVQKALPNHSVSFVNSPRFTIYGGEEILCRSRRAEFLLAQELLKDMGFINRNNGKLILDQYFADFVFAQMVAPEIQKVNAEHKYLFLWMLEITSDTVRVDDYGKPVDIHFWVTIRYGWK